MEKSGSQENRKLRPQMKSAYMDERRERNRRVVAYRAFRKRTLERSPVMHATDEVWWAYMRWLDIGEDWFIVCGSAARRAERMGLNPARQKGRI